MFYSDSLGGTWQQLGHYQYVRTVTSVFDIRCL